MTTTPQSEHPPFYDDNRGYRTEVPGYTHNPLLHIEAFACNKCGAVVMYQDIPTHDNREGILAFALLVIEP